MTETILPSIGAPFGGGYFAGLHPTEPGIAIVVAPRAEGEAPDELVWSESGDEAPGARSMTDGFANSEALNDDDHPAAQFCRGLTIDGQTDWYLPSVDEMTVIRRNLFPRAGVMPSQTAAEVFQKGAPEAFDLDWYWTSTEWGAGYAWIQDFNYGGQFYSTKSAEFRVRAVRKCPL